MKISVFYDHIIEATKQTSLSIRDVLKECKNVGIEGIEISYNLLNKDLHKITSDLQDNSLDISCIYGFYDFGKDANIDKAKGHVDLAAKLGVWQILIIPGFLDMEDALQLNSYSKSKEDTFIYMDRHLEISNMKHALIGIIDYAKDKGICVSLEDFDGLTAPFARIYQLLWFMENVPGLKYTLDTGNFVFSDEDVLKAYEILKSYIVHVHFKDRGEQEGREEGDYNKGMASVHTGDGYLPIKEIMDKLKEDKYRGYIAIEHYDAENQLEYMRQSAKFIKSL